MQRAAHAVEHPPTVLGAQVSECGIDVRRSGVRMVSQRRHDEVGVLGGRHAGRDCARRRVERDVRKRQCKPGSGPVGRGRVGGEGRRQAEKIE